jgi:hypothetical protein
VAQLCQNAIERGHVHSEQVDVGERIAVEVKPGRAVAVIHDPGIACEARVEN